MYIAVVISTFSNVTMVIFCSSHNSLCFRAKLLDLVTSHKKDGVIKNKSIVTSNKRRKVEIEFKIIIIICKMGSM